MRFTPGPGVGGHCIPVDPYYLAWRAREFDFVDRFVELAGDINYAMPRHVVDLVAEALNDRGRALKGARVGVIGVAFKPNVRDARNSPAADVIAGLGGRGAEVRYHDPHVPTFRDAGGASHALGRARRAARGQRRGRRRHRPSRRSISIACIATPSSSSTPSTARRGGRSGRASVLRLGAGWSAPERDAASERRRDRPRSATRPPDPVAMLVHSYYDEDPRVRREAEALVAAGRRGRRVRPPARDGPGVGASVDGVRVQRLDVQRHQGAGIGIVPARVPVVPRSCGLVADRAPIGGAATPSSRSTACRTSSSFAALPLRLARVPLLLDLHEAMPEFFRSRFPRAANPLAHRLLLLQERAVDRAGDGRRSPSTRRWPSGSSRSASAPDKVHVVANSAVAGPLRPGAPTRSGRSRPTGPSGSSTPAP